MQEAEECWPFALEMRREPDRRPNDSTPPPSETDALRERAEPECPVPAAISQLSGSSRRREQHAGTVADEARARAFLAVV